MRPTYFEPSILSYNPSDHLLFLGIDYDGGRADAAGALTATAALESGVELAVFFETAQVADGHLFGFLELVVTGDLVSAEFLQQNRFQLVQAVAGAMSAPLFHLEFGSTTWFLRTLPDIRLLLMLLLLRRCDGGMLS